MELMKTILMKRIWPAFVKGIELAVGITVAWLALSLISFLLIGTVVPDASVLTVMVVIFLADYVNVSFDVFKKEKK